MGSRKEVKFYTEAAPVTTVEELEKYLLKLGDDWQFRAQSTGDALTSTLERDCLRSGYDLKKDAPKIETEMIRQFTRVYDGIDTERVRKDKLYCLSLMRHYGAPTRLLDFTYSRYVAIYFALEYAYKAREKEERSAAIWCINVKGLYDQVKRENPTISRWINRRIEDKGRDDDTFDRLYIDNRYTFVCAENPVQLHRRLHLQQGVFLCPGNIRESFEDNLFHPYEKPTRDIRKLIFKPKDLMGDFERYYRMNLTRESLFPGLDGFAQSMRYQMWLYVMLHDVREDWRNGESEEAMLSGPRKLDNMASL